MSSTVLSVANHFLQTAKDGRGLSPIKLSRLTYIAFGWYAARTHSPLFKSDILAYDFGPIIPNLEEHLSSYRNDTINTSLAPKGASNSQPKHLPEEIQNLLNLSEETQNLLNEVWLTYSHYSSIQLANLTLAKGSPWEFERDQNPDQLTPRIKLSTFIAHYQRLAAASRDEIIEESNFSWRKREVSNQSPKKLSSPQR